MDVYIRQMVGQFACSARIVTIEKAMLVPGVSVMRGSANGR